MRHLQFSHRICLVASFAALTFLNGCVSRAVIGVTGSTIEKNAVVRSNVESVLKLGVKASDKQIVKGWGIFPSYHHGSVWGKGFDILHRRGVQQSLYKDLGINFMRVEIVPGYYDATQIDKLARDKNGKILMQGLLDHIKKARAFNATIQFVASVWSPPSSLKAPAYEEGYVWLNNTTKAKMDWCQSVEAVATRHETHLIGYGIGDGKSALSAQEIEYCNWIAAALKYLKRNGVGVPAAFSVQNELTYAPSYDGCVYDAAQWTRVVKKMRSTLDAAGLSSVVIFGPEGNNYADNTKILWNWYSGFSVDVKLDAAVGAIATHSYDDGWATPQQTNDSFQKFDQGINSYRAKEVWMTEYCTEGNTAPAGSSQLDWTINGMRHFAREMVRFRTQYWFWWMGWSFAASPNSNQLLYGQIADGSAAMPQKTKLYHVLSKLWKSAPPGCKVREMTSDNTQVFAPQPQAEDVNCDLVAFKNASSLVVLIVNRTGESRRVQLSGLTGTTAQTFRTTATQDMADTGKSTIATGSVSLTVPARSVSLVVTNA